MSTRSSPSTTCSAKTRPATTRAGAQGPNYEGDPCPKPEAADVDACPVSGRLLRLTAAGDKAVAETPLVTDWCQQFSSHSVGDLNFGPEGALYASGGEGASFTVSDYGQFGWPNANQCDDPPAGRSAVPTRRRRRLAARAGSADPGRPDRAERHGDPCRPRHRRRLSRQPAGLQPRPDARRIVAFGFRNPFRFAIDPVRGEVFVGNVGNGSYEEVDRFPLLPSSPTTPAGPASKARGPIPASRASNSISANASTTSRARPRNRSSTTATAARHAGRSLPGRKRIGDHRHGGLPRRLVPGGLRRRPLLRRRGARLHLHDPRRRGRRARPTDVAAVPQRRRPLHRRRHPGRPRRRSLLPQPLRDESLHRVSYDPGAPTARLERRQGVGAAEPHGPLRRRRFHRSRGRRPRLRLGPRRQRHLREPPAARSGPEPSTKPRTAGSGSR